MPMLNMFASPLSAVVDVWWSYTSWFVHAMLNNEPVPPTWMLRFSSLNVFRSPFLIFSPSRAIFVYFSLVISFITVSPAAMARGNALKVPENPRRGDAVSGSWVAGIFSGVMVSVVDA